MVVGSGLPESGSGMVFGASMSRPSTFTLILSTGEGAGLVSVAIVADILKSMERCRLSRRAARPLPFHLQNGIGGRSGPLSLIRCSLRHKFIPELPHKTLHRPGAGLAKGANRPA